MKEEMLIKKLYKKFKVFSEINDPIIENDPYHIYDNFGLFINDIIFICKEKQLKNRNFYGEFNLIDLYDKNDVCIEVENIFIFINELFETNDKVVIDILNTCIFEALMGNDYSYNLARYYLSKNAYNHFLEVTKRVI